MQTQAYILECPQKRVVLVLQDDADTGLHLKWVGLQKGFISLGLLHQDADTGLHPEWGGGLTNVSLSSLPECRHRLSFWGSY